MGRNGRLGVLGAATLLWSCDREIGVPPPSRLTIEIDVRLPPLEEPVPCAIQITWLDESRGDPALYRETSCGGSATPYLVNLEEVELDAAMPPPTHASSFGFFWSNPPWKPEEVHVSVEIEGTVRVDEIHELVYASSTVDGRGCTSYDVESANVVIEVD